jgi:hypothetical protein
MQLVWRMLEPVVQMQIGMWCAVALLTPRCTFLRLDVRTSTAHNLFLQGVTIARVLMRHVRVQQRKQGEAVHYGWIKPEESIGMDENILSWQRYSHLCRYQG